MQSDDSIELIYETKYKNLWVFIRSDAHPPGGLLLPLRGNSPCVVRAGLNIRGCGPLSTPGFFDRLGMPDNNRAAF